MLLHGILVAVLVYGWLQFKPPPPPIQALAIDATVVSQASLDAASHRIVAPPVVTPPPAPAPEPEPEQTVPPPPDPAAQQAAAQAQAEHEAAAAEAEASRARAAAQRDADQVARKHAAEVAEQEAASEKAAKEKAEHEAQAKAKAAAALAAKKAAAQAEAQARADAAAKAQAAESQADLKRSIEAEERLDAARAGGALSNWGAQIQARIQRAWIRPPSARAGIDCTLYVTQVPGGEVTNVRLGACNGDDAVRQSIQDAAYRASPLPPPPDPALFERNLEVRFHPTE